MAGATNLSDLELENRGIQAREIDSGEASQGDVLTADRRAAPASGGTHNFQATIEALSLMTDSLPTLVSGWLVRGLRGIVQAIALMVKQQWAQLAVPPERTLLPPREPGDGDDQNERTP